MDQRDRARTGLDEDRQRERRGGGDRLLLPGLSMEDNIAVVNRYRSVGVPIWATSTVVNPAGLAKAQEIMVVGGVLPADKKVAYDKIVANATPRRRSRSSRANRGALMLAPAARSEPAVAIRDVTLHYFTPERETLALSNVSLEVERGSSSRW